MRLRASLIVIAMAQALAASAVTSSHFDPETMMRTEQLRRGMTGYGLSVFSGTEITRFDVEVLGVLEKAVLGEDMILIRVTSGPIIERESGIVGGMSGTPIYVDGKLVGAIAYSWSFLREAIGGVTPIEAMLDSYIPGEQAALPADHPARGARLHGRWVERAVVDARGPAFVDERTIAMRPVSPIVSVAGMGEASMGRLQKLLDPHGLEAVPGPGRLGETVPVELEPGAAVGVKLMDGDFDATGMGTVTWRKGDTILAFGHPMMQMGAVEIPITTAWVHDFLPSVSFSSKMTSPMDIVGSMTQDGAWSIGARLGDEAPMVPARFTVVDEERDVTRSFEVEVAKHEMLTSELALTAMMASMEATYNPGSDGTGVLEFEVHGDDGAVIRRRDVIRHPGFVMPVAMWVDEALIFLTENRFDPQQVASVEARVSLSDEEKLATVERVYTDEHVARAGETLTVHVVMRPEGGEEFEKVVTFDLPQDLPKGQLRVGAAAGSEEFSLKAFLRLMLPQIDSLADIAELIETMKRADQLYVAAALPTLSLSVDGTELPRLPLNAMKLLAEDDRSNVEAGYTELSETIDTEYYLYGYQIGWLPTENRLGERGKVRKKPGEESERMALAPRMERLPHTWWAMDALQAHARPVQEAPGPPPGEEMPEDAPPLPEEIREKLEEMEEEPEEEEEEEEEVGEHPEPDGEALARGLSSFSHTEAKDFEKGEAEGTMVRSDGAVLLAPRADLLGELDTSRCWSLAVDGEGCWLGTANPGRVYRWQPGGEMELVAETGSFMVLSLLADGDGGVFAGTGPDGRVLQIAADGSTGRSWELPASYVWALERDGDGVVVAGTGPAGRVFRLGDEPELMAQISQPHVLDLLFDGERLLAAGGDNEGGVFEITGGGWARDIFGSEEKACTGLAVDDLGRLIVTTAEAGKAWIVEADGGGREVLESEGDVLDVAFAGGRAWVATAHDGELVTIDDRGECAVAARDKLAAEITRVAAGEGAVFATSGAPTRLWRLDLGAMTEGTYSSPALDAERVSRWASAWWDAEVPEGAQLQVQARSGNSRAADDGSWSAWIQGLTEPGQRITAPPARFLQYRLRMAGEPSAGPVLTRMELLYLPRNRRPTLKVSKPKPGGAMRGEYEISWDAEDEDGDTLAVTIFSRIQGAEQWRELHSLQGEDSWTWDTSEVKDGRYRLRVEVSDEPSNPGDAATEEVIVRDVTVDNGYPTLTLLTRPRRGDERLEVMALATDELTRLTSIDWTFGSEERWRAAPVKDGMLDSRRELFTISLPEIPDDETELKIRVRDAAGNVTVESVPLLDRQPEGEVEAQPLPEDTSGEESE
ncbi:MAG: SpoIVB peptidase S55 domain-containing protein [Armatimonadota bacterium]|nr:SpoIVB peptidase S55 domain-containing protein [Armatimonadota bacterium]